MVAIGVVAMLVNSFAIVKYGRRRVMLTIGLALAGFLQLIQAIIYQQHPGTKSTGKAIIGVSVIYVCVYNVSAITERQNQHTAGLLLTKSQGMISSFAWLSSGEIPSQRLRSYTFGLAAAIGFLFAVSCLIIG